MERKEKHLTLINNGEGEEQAKFKVEKRLRPEERRQR